MMVKRILLGFFFASLVISLADFTRENQADRNAGTLVAAKEETQTTIYLPLVADGFVDVPDFSETPFGIEVRPLNDAQGLQKVAESGSSFTRLNGILWAAIEPQQGQRNWSAVAVQEAQLKLAAENDLRVILVVRHTPPWAQKVPGSYCGPIKASKFEAFGDFMYDLVARYSAAPYYVKNWEIYNEPDVDPILIGPTSPFGCWGDLSDPLYGGGHFANMLKVAYPKIKQADPEAQVLVGGVLLSCNPASGKCNDEGEILASKFFEGILAGQGGNYFDGVAFHNYDIYMYELGTYFSRKWDSYWSTTGPSLIAKTDFLKNVMEDYGVSGKFLMNTETGLLCGPATDPPASPGCESEPDSPYELTKAYYIVQSYAAAIASGLRANIWYSTTGWRNTGLVYSDYSPRPAFTAYQFAQEQLGEAEFVGLVESEDIGGSTGLGGYKFQSPDGKLIWVIWAKDRSTHLVTPSNAPDAARDMFGNEIALLEASSLMIALEPRYLEWNP